jgi:hypothetical protein
VTRRDLFRRRIAPILFGVAIALMARKSCQSHGLTHATYVLDYGAAEPNVAAVDLDVWMDADVPIAHFHRAALGAHIGPSKFEGSFPSTDGLMKFDIAMRDGSHKMFDRRVHADENAIVTVNLEPDLK